MDPAEEHRLGTFYQTLFFFWFKGLSENEYESQSSLLSGPH